MEKTKWNGYEFSKNQKRARVIWRNTEKSWWGLLDGLRIDNSRTRAQMHKQLDRRLDIFEKRRKQARELFPEVSDSFGLFEGVVRLGQEHNDGRS